MGKSKQVSSLALVSPEALIGHGVTIWHWTQVRERAVIGEGSNLGQHVYVGPGVSIGSRCKIQNGAQIFEPAVIEEGVFVGPNVIFTNDLSPRAVVGASMEEKGEADWEKVEVLVKVGASIGAGVVCVAPVTIGEWAMVGAGAVVTGDVQPYSLVVGNPARHIGWVGKSGHRLIFHEDRFLCPVTKEVYEQSSEGLLNLVNGVS